MAEPIGRNRTSAAYPEWMPKAALLSEVNQGILLVAAGSIDKEQEWEFFCECGREDCYEYVSLTLEAYASQHRAGAIVARGHRLSRAETSQPLLEEVEATP